VFALPLANQGHGAQVRKTKLSIDPAKFFNNRFTAIDVDDKFADNLPAGRALLASKLNEGQKEVIAVQWWDMEGKPLQTFVGPTTKVFRVAISPKTDALDTLASVGEER
jgi:hypothetical protein